MSDDITQYKKIVNEITEQPKYKKILKKAERLRKIKNFIKYSTFILFQLVIIGFIYPETFFGNIVVTTYIIFQGFFMLLLFAMYLKLDFWNPYRDIKLLIFPEVASRTITGLVYNAGAQIYARIGEFRTLVATKFFNRGMISRVEDIIDFEIVVQGVTIPVQGQEVHLHKTNASKLKGNGFLIQKVYVFSLEFPIDTFCTQNSLYIAPLGSKTLEHSGGLRFHLNELTRYAFYTLGYVLVLLFLVTIFIIQFRGLKEQIGNNSISLDNIFFIVIMFFIYLALLIPATIYYIKGIKRKIIRIQPQKMDDVRFSDKFIVECSDPIFARMVLNSKTMERYVESGFDRYEFLFVDNFLYIKLLNKKDLMEIPNTNYTKNFEYFYDFQRELLHLKSFIESLDGILSLKKNL